MVEDLLYFNVHKLEDTFFFHDEIVAKEKPFCMTKKHGLHGDAVIDLTSVAKKQSVQLVSTKKLQNILHPPESGPKEIIENNTATLLNWTLSPNLIACATSSKSDEGDDWRSHGGE